MTDTERDLRLFYLGVAVVCLLSISASLKTIACRLHTIVVIGRALVDAEDAKREPVAAAPEVEHKTTVERPVAHASAASDGSKKTEK
jgi:hypothetical protein